MFMHLPNFSTCSRFLITGAVTAGKGASALEFGSNLWLFIGTKLFCKSQEIYSWD
jgi:hypothetical protein